MKREEHPALGVRELARALSCFQLNPCERSANAERRPAPREKREQARALPKLSRAGKGVISFILVLLSALSLAQQPIRVACVGDSITAGVGASKGKAYPEQLQAMLGPRYRVMNFGVSGATLLQVGPVQYVKQPQYRDALASKPDIVLIMLGTNDANKDKWPAARDTFVPLAKELFSTLKNLPSHPKVYACLPVPSFTEGDDRPTNTANEVGPLIAQAAREAGVSVIDLHSPLEGRLDLFPDRLHPNDAGAGVMAEEVYETIVDPRLAKEGWKIVSADSQQVDEGPAANAIDGNPDTYWHTQYDPTTQKHPHEIVVDTGKVQEIGGFRYLPRQDGGVNGRINEYRFYVSVDGQHWGEPASSGTFKNTSQPSRIRFAKVVTGRYFKLVALSEVNKGPWTTAAEIDILRPFPVGPR